MKFKRIICGLLAAVLGFSVLTGCKKGEGEILIISPDGVPFLNLAKLATDKDLEYENYTFSYEIAANLDVLQTKLNGDASFAIAPLNVGANLFNQNQNYVLAAATSYGIMYMVSTDQDVSSAKSWDSLKGKTIHTMAQGGTPDAVLRLLLSSNGIEVATTDGEAGKVTIKYLDTHQTLWAQMKAGNISTIVTSEPGVSVVLASQTNANITPTLIFDLQDEWGKATGTNKAYPQTGLFVKKSLIQDDEDLVKKVLNAIKESTNFASLNAQNREAAGNMAADFGSSGLNGTNCKNSFERVQLAFITGNDCKVLVSNYLNKLFDFKPQLIGGKLPEDSFYYA